MDGGSNDDEDFYCGVAKENGLVDIKIHAC